MAAQQHSATELCVGGTKSRPDQIINGKSRRNSRQSFKFPLTTKQCNVLTSDAAAAKVLISHLSEQIAPSTIAVCSVENKDRFFLVLEIQVSAEYKKQCGGSTGQINYRMNNLTTEALQPLERIFGILLSSDEIAQIRTEIGTKIFSSEGVICTDRYYLDCVKEELCNAVECNYYYSKKGKSRKSFLTIPDPKPNEDQRHSDRLYWKDDAESKNEEKESLHLSEIEEVTMGKGQNTPADADENFCFSLVTKKQTRDYSMTGCPSIEVRMIVAYLNAVCRHFTQWGVRRL